MAAKAGDGGGRMMTAALDWIVVPMGYPFMQRALIVSVMVGAVCAVLSCYLVLKGSRMRFFPASCWLTFSPFRSRLAHLWPACVAPC
jgi:hypothetical protein